eukprot:7227083-Pyramimonas_sp.AAC.1
MHHRPSRFSARGRPAERGPRRRFRRAPLSGITRALRFASGEHTPRPPRHRESAAQRCGRRQTAAYLA